MLLVALAFASCVNHFEEEEGVQAGNTPISFKAKVSRAATKVTGQAFDSGDRVGLFAMISGVSLSGNRYIDNLRLECSDGSTLIPDYEVFYPEGGMSLDFISYYPYKEKGVAEGQSTIPVEVATDQTSDESFSTSDFLVAKENGVNEKKSSIELTYKHQLCKVVLVLVPQEGTDAERLLAANPTVVATGFKTKAVYDLAAGSLSGIDWEADIKLHGEWTEDEGNLTGKELIVIPQESGSDTQAFLLEWDGKIYTCPMPQLEEDMKANTVYTIEISTKKDENATLSTVVGSIGDWEFNETGESANSYELNAIHVSSLSFATSDVYRAYYQGRPIAEVCKEFLRTNGGDFAETAIVAYSVDENDETVLTNGQVLQVLGREDENIHGGTVVWDEESNTLDYTPGNQAPIAKFYIGQDEQITLEKPETALKVNVRSYTLRDVRKEEFVEYPIVKIATQYWMRENLRATHYSDSGVQLKEIKGLREGGGYILNDGEYWYNKQALMGGQLAPRKWAIPNWDDWNKLKAYVENKASMLKGGTWGNAQFASEDGKPFTNETGFTALPVGYYDEGTGQKLVRKNQGSTIMFWAAGEDGLEPNTKTIALVHSSNELRDAGYRLDGTSEGDYTYSCGLSIRCIKR